ncbi:folylpolyglutamate synthase/dihydrofolate synthase family protein [Bacillus sp. V5-8f]|uniref:bifunctional folylpolyglutamate synthase/dihydrofolate synthase n=1 Tax=Bacillus sp. V5-8f TaxID=2053044 RepID=UPI000C7882C6|nr:folylpolyglutamate synthase/dihydrofolate synthase family protein [Bacillus sp. V5-8f]PLT32382.1 bifunctional folylpolyglutamate synthase/dihydrofolate synthase [Bacillus sp. V5-8f]
MNRTTMAEIEQYLIQRQMKLGMDFGLSRMEKLLDYLGNPHLNLKFIHIAGSNGKGSTLNFIREILIEAGVSVGAFTSPYLESINEQFMINKEMIHDREFISIFNQIEEVVELMDKESNGPTQFEILTAIAFIFFKRNDVDLALIEAGLGGRLDSTNVVTPILSIITSISLEHTNILGNSIEMIAREKAGIVKKGVTIISGVNNSQAEQVIRLKAESENAPLFQLGREFAVEARKNEDTSQAFLFRMGEYVLENVRLAMLGKHQAENASCALTAIRLINERDDFSINEESMRKGLCRAAWRARFELLSRSPLIILDGAHNPAGISVLTETLHSAFPEKKYRFLFTALNDKNYQEMIQLLDQNAEEVIFTEIPHARAAKAEELYEWSKSRHKKWMKNWQMAIEEAMKNLSESEALIITGSLYFLALARPYAQAVLEGKFK